MMNIAGNRYANLGVPHSETFNIDVVGLDTEAGATGRGGHLSVQDASSGRSNDAYVIRRITSIRGGDDNIGSQ
jgi:hypothetical protein